MKQNKPCCLSRQGKHRLLYGGTKQMKMLKKLLAVVLTGAMALTLLTACGSNAVTEKSIADAMTDMAKAQSSNATFTPRAEERELARKYAALAESGTDNQDNIKKILDYDQGGANENNFVWTDTAFTDELGTSGQAYKFIENNSLLMPSRAWNGNELFGKKPAKIHYMGTALYKGTDKKGNPVTVRVIVVTAKAEG